VARINCYGHHHDIELSAIVEGALWVGPLELVPEREALRRDGGAYLPSGADMGELFDEPDEARVRPSDYIEDAHDEPETAAGQ
jgi:hypothetical protein